MAATTITAYSTELNQTSPGSPQLYAPLKANQHRAKTRMSSFNLVLASQASGTSFAVAIIPKGARILGGYIAASATLANSATLAVGLAGAPSVLGGTATGYIDDNLLGATVATPALATTSTSAVSDSTTCLKAAAAQGTAQVPFAITQALGFLYETAKDCYLTLTTGTGTVSTETVTGYVLYAVE